MVWGFLCGLFIYGLQIAIGIRQSVATSKHHRFFIILASAHYVVLSLSLSLSLALCSFDLDCVGFFKKITIKYILYYKLDNISNLLHF